ncbi:major membrane immunogen (membrane-anchored lipoprotein) [Alkalibacillus filiformis]|uniref:Major membrane immunogen (Membrane-anchored lipoprotein) n=1 Tax=Alkalibacillus filiformis TaxID=200990 RepID=A0ABU0DTN9_9BACI|nr:DUF3221 domain-containing protein [Alkalibacillus filiformis]MDQ0351824.1 major membrane immunogen (membrane-anchored lipoprotein) [Alkalibacillus filiformis]
MKKMVVLMVIIVLLTACGQSNQNVEENVQKVHEGTIADKRERHDGTLQFLLVSNVEEEEIQDKSEGELISLAQDEDGAYYSVNDEKFDELSIGQQVEVSWNGNQEESNPPQRVADMIETISNP